MRVAVGAVNKPDEKALKRGFTPNYVHSYDACLLKTAFRQWNKQLVTIHDCIAVLPCDMDEAQERIRRAMIDVCQEDPLAKIADELEVSTALLERLLKGKGELMNIQKADKMFN